MACTDACDRGIPGSGAARAADSSLWFGGEASAGCGAGSCGLGVDLADCGACGALGRGGFARAGVLCGVARGEEREKVSMLQTANHGGGRGHGERGIAALERTQWAFFQDGEGSADYTERSLAAEIQR